MSEARELLDRLLHIGDPEQAIVDSLEFLLRREIEQEPTPERKVDGFWTQWPPRP